MSKIKIENIQEEAKEHGWKLVSDSYKNLDSELTWECSEGHLIYMPFKKVRNKWECPICALNAYKNLDSKIVIKKPGVRRTLALDQSSRLTGWSIFDNEELIHYGVFETDYKDEIERAYALRMWLISMVNNWAPDYIGIEGIQFQQQMGVTTFQTLARIQGIVMETCFEIGVKYEICPTNTWRHYCGVKGRSRIDKKRSTQLLIKEWYDISVSEDEADAIGIGKYMAESVIKQPEIVEWE